MTEKKLEPTDLIGEALLEINEIMCIVRIIQECVKNENDWYWLLNNIARNLESAMDAIEGAMIDWNNMKGVNEG